jgi:hypothetical protein
MGEIIPFPAERIRPSRAADQIHRAQILFFTGVRYERPDPSPRDMHPRRRRKRKRA